MKKYSTKYWLRHYEYALLGAEKHHKDTSDAEWTRRNLNYYITGEGRSFGKPGLAGVIAFVDYVETYHYENRHEIIGRLEDFVESIEGLTKVKKYLGI